MCCGGGVGVVTECDVCCDAAADDRRASEAGDCCGLVSAHHMRHA